MINKKLNKVYILFFLSCLVPFKSLSDPKSIANDFFNFLQKQKYEKCFQLFDSRMKSIVTSDKLQTVWEDQLTKSGKFIKLQDIKESQVNGLSVFVFACEYELSYINITISEKDNLVAGFYCNPTIKNLLPFPEYIQVNTFEERNIQFGQKDWMLDGKLTISKNNKDNIYVILINGFGPQDMDATFGPNKPFRDIAFGLASNGISSLRYHKRTFQYSDKVNQDIDNLTLEEEQINDAINAFNYLVNTEKVLPSKIYILGFQIGALSLPLINSKIGKIGGYIFTETPFDKLQDILLKQKEYLYNLKGRLTADEITELAKFKMQISNIKYLGNTNSTYTSKDLPMNLSPKYWLFMEQYDYINMAKSIDSPALMIHSEFDYLVPFENFESWKSELRNKSNFEFSKLLKSNHLFMPSRQLSTPDDESNPGYVVNSLINILTNWINSKK